MGTRYHHFPTATSDSDFVFDTIRTSQLACADGILYQQRRTELEKTNMNESDWPDAYTVVEKNSTVLKMLWMLGNEPQLRVLLTRSSNPALNQALRSFETLLKSYSKPRPLCLEIVIDSGNLAVLFTEHSKFAAIVTAFAASLGPGFVANLNLPRRRTGTCIGLLGRLGIESPPHFAE
jgi:hypothetical protein